MANSFDFQRAQRTISTSDNNLSISSLTNGVDPNGAIEYVKELNTNAIQTAIQRLNETVNLKNVFREGWQGKAEQTFETNLDKIVEVVTGTLNEIELGIESLVSELVNDLIEQDTTMIKEFEIK